MVFSLAAKVLVARRIIVEPWQLTTVRGPVMCRRFSHRRTVGARGLPLWRWA